MGWTEKQRAASARADSLALVELAKVGAVPPTVQAP
jgi:hypothetical protein